MKNLLVLMLIGLFVVGCSNDDFDEMQAISDCNSQVTKILEDYKVLAHPYSSVLASGGTLTSAEWNEYDVLLKNQQADIDALPCKQ